METSWIERKFHTNLIIVEGFFVCLFVLFCFVFVFVVLFCFLD